MFILTHYHQKHLVSELKTVLFNITHILLSFNSNRTQGTEKFPMVGSTTNNDLLTALLCNTASLLHRVNMVYAKLFQPVSLLQTFP